MYLSVLSGELFYALFFRQLADEQSVVVLGHDVTVEPLDDHLLLLSGVNHAVVRLEQVDVVADAAVSVEVFPGLGEQ